MSQTPANPKLYHIVHVDRLASIVTDGRLLCDAAMLQRPAIGTTVGMANIKQRRLTLPLESHPGLMVGGCVPFYFCPRSLLKKGVAGLFSVLFDDSVLCVVLEPVSF